MSYGNCCLTSDIAGCTDVAGECGVTFSQGNTEELQKMVQYLCDNPEIVAKYRAVSAEYICGKFNWNDVVSRTLDVYKGEKK